ncbi:MAG TPA: hypothetical protein VNC62_15630 [Burkholderiales bacterium]|nr:hypothetical protein [Burkholderiales bacterium]
MLCLLSGNAAAQSVSPRPLQRATDDHLALLMSRAYDQLDHAADEARTKQIALSDGQPLLTAIYAGVIGCGCGNQLNEELWQVRKQRVEEWARRKPRSLTARLAVAGFPIGYAWMARGGGYASTVSPEGWKLFHERVEQGRKALQALDARIKQDPGWYELMLNVAVSQGWPRERFDALFSEAAGKHPYYSPFYFIRVSYYSPGWYGSLEDAKRVVEDAVERTRPRWGETMYARLNWRDIDTTMFEPGKTDWPRMRAGFQQMTKEYGDAWNTNNFAKFACVAKDYETFSGLAAKIGESPIPEAWEPSVHIYKGCQKIAAKMAGQR